jgi:integral membrane protein (TIGR01906 family)
MKIFTKIAAGFIAITLPFMLMMFSIRILFTPLFLSFEYNFPGFPRDTYGFSTQERMHWGTESITYLFDRSNRSSLADLKFEDGSNIYNEREISHMVDVKILLRKALNVFYIFLGIYLIIFLLSYKAKTTKTLLKGLSSGGWLTIGIIGLIIAAVVISFNQLFTLFHKLFFTGDTWLFNYSDTLIRLFPMRLWQDAFILMGGITLIIAFIFAIYSRKLISGTKAG